MDRKRPEFGPVRSILWNEFVPLFSGDITHKGYEKKRAKLLIPLLEDQVKEKEKEREELIASKTNNRQEEEEEEEEEGQDHQEGNDEQHSPMQEARGDETRNNQEREDVEEISSPTTKPTEDAPTATYSKIEHSAASSATVAETATNPEPVPGPSGSSSVSQQPPKDKKPRSRNRHKRYTHSEKRYHSEVRQEAVQQALAAMHGKAKALPLPSKRSSVMRASQNEHADDEDDIEDDSREYSV